MKVPPFFMALVIALMLAGAAFADNLRAQIGTEFSAMPVRVVDGDTFKLHDGSIRLWGFDTPEHYQPKFFAAAAKLEELIANVRLTCRVRDIDRYHRRVAQCFLPDGRDIGAEMVASGLARDYTRYSKGYYKKYERQQVSFR